MCQRMVSHGGVQGAHRPPQQAGSAREVLSLRLSQFQNGLMFFSCQGRTAGYLPSLMACLIAAHVSEVPTAVCVDVCRSLDSPTIKSLSQVTLASSTQAVSKAGNGSRSQSDGLEAGDCLLCEYSFKAAFQSCSFLGEQSSTPPVLHMDLESESRLLMSTSSKRNFAFMCLYSLYSSAIGLRSSFWTFLPFCLKKLSSKS